MYCMNTKVLFVLKEYYPKPAPTGVCVQNVQRGLLKLGIKSDVLQLGEDDGLVGENEYGNIYSINTVPLRYDTTKRNVALFYLRKIPLFFKWPIFSYRTIRRYKEWIKKLNEKELYGAIIGVVLPVETVMASKEFGNFILYELDSIVNNPEYKRGVKKFFQRRLRYIEKRIYNKAQLIIHLENNREYYTKNDKYNTYKKKFVYTDVPNLIELKGVSLKKNEVLCPSSNQYNITYLGSLFPDYRSPEYIISIIKKASESVDVCCTFYSRGACEDIIEQSEREKPNIIRKGGYVEHSIVSDIICRADFLLSIGNKLTGDDYSLPSKVIEYISSGKPIIHVSGGKNDSAVSYLEKYGLACIIDPNNSIEENTKKLVSFLKERKGEYRAFQDLRVLFEKNDPTFTAKIIEHFINNL